MLFLRQRFSVYLRLASNLKFSLHLSKVRTTIPNIKLNVNLNGWENCYTKIFCQCSGGCICTSKSRLRTQACSEAVKHFILKAEQQLGLVAHAFNPNTEQLRQENCCEFQINLSYRMKSCLQFRKKVNLSNQKIEQAVLNVLFLQQQNN